MRRFSFGAAAFAVVALTVALTGASAATPGTWSQYPNGVTVYQAAVQQPLDGANTSNWSSKSKGAIPVMFTLSSGTGPAVFESIGSDGFAGYTQTGNFADDYAWAAFSPSGTLTFDDVSTLKADYTFTLGNCHGGSIRWEIGTGSGALQIYYGDTPNFTDCTTTSQSGANMIGLSDLRYDTSQFAGGTFYDTYTHAKTLMGTLPITYAEVVIDGGWQNIPNGDQRATVSNITVNDTVYQWNAGGTGQLGPTCDLPDATIQVGKTDPVADGDVNEAPVQASLADSGNAFRVVDCKYQYNLSIPSLKGAGTYYVEIQIGGNTVGKAQFDLK